jgi:hypothetical protein
MILDDTRMLQGFAGLLPVAIFRVRCKIKKRAAAERTVAIDGIGELPDALHGAFGIGFGQSAADPSS